MFCQMALQAMAVIVGGKFIPLQNRNFFWDSSD